MKQTSISVRKRHTEQERGEYDMNPLCSILRPILGTGWLRP